MVKEIIEEGLGSYEIFGLKHLENVSKLIAEAKYVAGMAYDLTGIIVGGTSLLKGVNGIIKGSSLNKMLLNTAESIHSSADIVNTGKDYVD